MAATVKIEGLTQFNQMLEGLKRESDQSERLMKLVSLRIRSIQMKHFKDEVDSKGNKWQELSQARIKQRSGRVGKAIQRRIAKGRNTNPITTAVPLFASSRYPKLQDTGRLKNSITAFSDSKSAGAGTNVIYAAIHQFGGKAGRGQKANIPKREYLYINAAEKEVLTAMVIKQMIQSQLGGGQLSQ